MSSVWGKRQVSASEDALARVFSQEFVTLGLSDNVAASNLSHVCRAMGFKIGVHGKNVSVPSKKLSIVRKYLAGEIDPKQYRDGMPTDYYGWRDSIYVRQAM